MVRLLLIASLCIACCGASRNAMVKLSGQLCSALFVHFKQVTMMYQKCLSMPLRTWGRAKFCEGCKPGDQVFNTHYPTVELKKKSHVLEQFKRRRQSAPAQPSTHSLSGHTSDWLWARFEQPPLPPPPLLPLSVWLLWRDVRSENAPVIPGSAISNLWPTWEEQCVRCSYRQPRWRVVFFSVKLLYALLAKRSKGTSHQQ